MNRSRGFTLLELVISMALISTAVLAVSRLQAQNLDLQAEARFLTTADQLLRLRLSEIRALEKIREGASEGDFGDAFSAYSYTQEIRQVSEYENILRIDLVILLDDGLSGKIWSTTAYIYRLGA
jgi:prepilin-type N-terminal cleavage/methylation domain-containing protein